MKPRMTSKVPEKMNDILSTSAAEVTVGAGALGHGKDTRVLDPHSLVNGYRGVCCAGALSGVSGVVYTF